MRPIRGTLPPINNVVPPINTTVPPPSSSLSEIVAHHQPSDSLFGKNINNTNNSSSTTTTSTHSPSSKKVIVVSAPSVADTSQASTTVNTLYSGRYSSSCPPNVIPKLFLATSNLQGIGGGGNSSPNNNSNGNSHNREKMNASNGAIERGDSDWGHHRASAETTATTMASAAGFSLTIENEAEATRRYPPIHAGRPSAQQQQQQFSYSASLSQISDAARDIVKSCCFCCCNKNNNSTAAVDNVCCRNGTATRGGAASFLSNLQTAKRSRRLVLIFTLVLVCVIFTFDRWNSTSSSPSSSANDVAQTSSSSRSSGGIKYGGAKSEAGGGVEDAVQAQGHDEPSRPPRRRRGREGGGGSHRNDNGVGNSGSSSVTMASGGDGGGRSSSNGNKQHTVEGGESTTHPLKSNSNKKEEKTIDEKNIGDNGHEIVEEGKDQSPKSGSSDAEPFTIFHESDDALMIASEHEGNKTRKRRGRNSSSERRKSVALANPSHLSSSSLMIPEQEQSEFLLGASSEQALDPRYVDTHHLILVAGHAVFKGIDYTAWANPSNWAFESWQREMSSVVTEVMVQTYAAHIKKGLETMLSPFEDLKRKYSMKQGDGEKHDEDSISTGNNSSPSRTSSGSEQQQDKQETPAVAATVTASVSAGGEREKGAEVGGVLIESKQKDAIVAEMLDKRQRIKESILLFSGGQSRSDSGPRSEGLSYYMIALAMNFFNVFDSGKGLDLPLSPLAALIEKLKESTGSNEEVTTALSLLVKEKSSLFGESSSKLLPLLALSSASSSSVSHLTGNASSSPPHPSHPSGPHHSSLSTFLAAWGKLSANEQHQIVLELEKRLRAEALEPHIASEPVLARVLAEQHIFVEDFARDSYENLLFSVARFHEITGKYPKKITVVGFEYKRERFERVHREAIRFPAEDFCYIGIDYVEAAADAGIEIPPLRQTSAPSDPLEPIASSPPKENLNVVQSVLSKEIKKKKVVKVSGGSSDDSDDENDYDDSEKKKAGILAAGNVGNKTSALQELVGGTAGGGGPVIAAGGPSSNLLIVQQKDESEVAAAKFLRLPSDANTIAYVKKDIYLCNANAATRRKRNPQHRVEPYRRSAPQMEALLRHCGPELFDGSLPWRK